MHGKRILLTGGAGFLGSHFVRHALESGAEVVVNVDALAYSGDVRRLDFTEGDSRYRFIEGDLTDIHAISKVFSLERPEVVVHFAAETHVTRSESDPKRFYRTNVEGTHILLDSSIEQGVQRLVHISTDEVYGPINEGLLVEDDKVEGDSQATSAYAKSKSLADDLVRSYADKLDVVVARPTNAFGPWQFPEKACPRWITRGLRGQLLPVWGDGLYIRQWLFAKDLADAVSRLITSAPPGEVYNVGPLHHPEITNLDLANWIADRLNISRSQIELTAYDRPEHDRRYALDSSKIRALGWQPGDVWEQLGETIEWYRTHEAWWRSHIEEAESIYTDSKR